MFPIANFSTPVGWVIYANTVTGGLFWDLVLAAIFIISVGTFIRSTTIERAFAASSFLPAILAAFLLIIGGIQPMDAAIFIALAVVGFVLLLFNRE